MTPYNTDAAKRNLQEGRKKMEAAMTPVQRALRRYGLGRPPIVAKTSPLAVVALATDQRARLLKILQSEPGLVSPVISRMAVVIRVEGAREGALADAIVLEEGKESAAISALECYHARYEVVGVMFRVTEASTPNPILFAYLIDRTPEGAAALKWSFDRQMSGAVKKDN